MEDRVYRVERKKRNKFDRMMITWRYRVREQVVSVIILVTEVWLRCLRFYVRLEAKP